jgi:hypothetical protein
LHESAAGAAKFAQARVCRLRHFANPPERNSHGKGAALALAQTALVAYGRIDVWVNDAGVGADGVVSWRSPRSCRRSRTGRRDP